MPKPTKKPEPTGGGARAGRLLPGMLIGAIMVLILIAVVSFN
jgi:hypothetical protein